MSPTLGNQQDQFGDRQFVVLTSEKQARVVALPSHNCVYRQQLADTDFVVKAEIISLKGMKEASFLTYICHGWDKFKYHCTYINSRYFHILKIALQNIVKFKIYQMCMEIVIVHHIGTYCIICLLFHNSLYNQSKGSRVVENYFITLT